MQYSQCTTPFGVEMYMCVAGSGGGTRFARLPPVIEIIPRSGYLTHATCLKGLKGILNAHLPPVRNAHLVPGVSGYTLNPRLFISLRFHAFQTVMLIRCAYHILTDKFCYIGAKHLIIRYVQRIKSLVEFSFYFLIQSDRTKMPHFCAFHFKFLIQL